MDENINTTSGAPISAEVSGTGEKNSGWGAIIGIIIIVLLILAGGWYFITNRLEKIEEQKQNTAEIEVLTGASTEVDDIQADLDNLNLDILDEE